MEKPEINTNFEVFRQLLAQNNPQLIQNQGLAIEEIASLDREMADCLERHALQEKKTKKLDNEIAYCIYWQGRNLLARCHGLPEVDWHDFACESEPALF